VADRVIILDEEEPTWAHAPLGPASARTKPDVEGALSSSLRLATIRVHWPFLIARVTVPRQHL
jgi:hypothetical protein